MTWVRPMGGANHDSRPRRYAGGEDRGDQHGCVQSVASAEQRSNCSRDAGQDRLASGAMVSLQRVADEQTSQGDAQARNPPVFS